MDYSEYKFIKTSTAGNRTLYVIGKNAYKNKDIILRILLNKKNIEAEQIGFLTNESNKCILTMAGGELCGGAILAAPCVLSKQIKKTCVITSGKTFKTYLTNRDKNKIYIKSELPKNIIFDKPKQLKSKVLGNIEGFKVNLDGISYFVTEGNLKENLNYTNFTLLDVELCTRNSPCLGVIEVLNGKIKPTIWVKKLGTIIAEQGCTTGTISTQLCFPRNDSTWQQPSGEYITSEINDAKIGIEASVEILSEGKIYFNNQ